MNSSLNDSHNVNGAWPHLRDHFLLPAMLTSLILFLGNYWKMIYVLSHVVVVTETECKTDSIYSPGRVSECLRGTEEGNLPSHSLIPPRSSACLGWTVVFQISRSQKVRWNEQVNNFHSSDLFKSCKIDRRRFCWNEGSHSAIVIKTSYLWKRITQSVVKFAILSTYIHFLLK